MPLQLAAITGLLMRAMASKDAATSGVKGCLTVYLLLEGSGVGVSIGN
jgi:hypothetical protein